MNYGLVNLPGFLFNCILVINF